MNRYVRFNFVMRLLLASVFAYASITKAWPRERGGLTPTVYSDWAQGPFARHTVIGAEAVLALWLISGRRSDAAAAVSLALLSAFTGLVVMELTKDHPKACGCMGTNAIVEPAVIRAWLRFDLLRDVFMMAGAGWLYLSRNESRIKIQRTFPNAPIAAHLALKH
jgi:hypothetical protein